jgi:hypothetical protein
MNSSSTLTGRLGNHFTRTHLWVAGVLLAFFMAVNLYCCARGWRAHSNEKHVTVAVLGTVTGPFTGALSRPGQPFCLQTALSLLPWCVLGIGLAVGGQFVPVRFPRLGPAIRMAVWILGLLIWFAASVASLLTAID